MPTSIRLTQETEARLDALAASTGQTKVYLLRKIIEQGLPELEEYYLAAEVLERVRHGKEATYSSSDVRKEIGLGD